MIITSIRNWKPDPGTLLEWQPTHRARIIADAAPADSIPPTFLQENHVQGYLAKKSRGESHRAFLGVASEVDGDLDVVALTRALTRFVHRHDVLHTFFSADGGIPVVHRVDRSAIDFEAADAGDLTDSVDFQAYILARFESEATSVRWPGFAFGAVLRPGGFTLYYGCDHAFTDGASQALAFSELADLYQSEISATTPSPYTTALTDGFSVYARAEHERAAAYDTESPEVREWLTIFADNGNKMPSFSLDLGLTPGQTAPVRPVELDLLDAPSTVSFDAVCKAAGGKLISGIYAAVSIADYELAGRSDYYGMSVLSSRGLGNFHLSQGWMCSFAPVAFHVGATSTFTELVAAAHAGHLRAKRLADVPIRSVLLALLEAGVAGHDVAASPNMLSYIDFRWFPGVGTPPYEGAMEFTGEGETSNASMWFNRDARHLYLGSQTPDTAAARTQLEVYHQHLKRIFTTVAAHGEYRLSPAAATEELHGLDRQTISGP
ncbi:hypothetical protein ABH922_002593 [Rhodococcus sp. 27YEA15]|uniref:condensation domain-containing protein n=1 Tax=Rhodococcus sp. 27YEA15 TaxID=3156259 RepID=UPI003C7CFA0B